MDRKISIKIYTLYNKLLYEYIVVKSYAYLYHTIYLCSIQNKTPLPDYYTDVGGVGRGSLFDHPHHFLRFKGNIQIFIYIYTMYALSLKLRPRSAQPCSIGHDMRNHA